MRYICSINAMPLLNYIGKIVSLDDSDIEIILNNCKEVLIPKGHIIFNEGKIARYAYFIVSGKARSYYTDYAGKTITWSFHFNEIQSDFKNLFIVDHKSFLTQTPGTLRIEALTDIKAIRFGQPRLDSIYGHVPILDQCLRKLNEYSFVMAYDRVFNLLTLSATDRYNQLLRNEPHLLRMFPDKYLASYIGIEPPSLSRIRKNLLVKPVQRNVMSLAT
jgi:CRP/FNR family transcriptional regulator, anaerobic regulatory protein